MTPERIEELKRMLEAEALRVLLNGTRKPPR